MNNRRKFIRRSAFGTAALALGSMKGGMANTMINRHPAKEMKAAGNSPKPRKRMTSGRLQSGPLSISTWNHGLPANDAAMEILRTGGTALDAAEAGVRVPEADPQSTSVGYGGLPDRDGHVTLDACIMGPDGNCGSVSFLENIMHPISVARKVMEDTPHVMLSGEGARQFAMQQGFPKKDLLTQASKKRWKQWMQEQQYKPVINIENHDTIGLLTIDSAGDMAGACTTSGLAWKMHGRVGDSPIIGAGLFVDNEVGGATATGMGEAVMKTCGTFLVVELMRQGASPQQACEEAVHRIVSKQEYKNLQVGYLAVNKKGETGAYAIQKGFSYALGVNGENKMYDSASYL